MIIIDSGLLPKEQLDQKLKDAGCMSLGQMEEWAFNSSFNRYDWVCDMDTFETSLLVRRRSDYDLAEGSRVMGRFKTYADEVHRFASAHAAYSVIDDWTKIIVNPSGSTTFSSVSAKVKTHKVNLVDNYPRSMPQFGFLKIHSLVTVQDFIDSVAYQFQSALRYRMEKFLRSGLPTTFNCHMHLLESDEEYSCVFACESVLSDTLAHYRMASGKAA